MLNHKNILQIKSVNNHRLDFTMMNGKTYSIVYNSQKDKETQQKKYENSILGH